ncbi:type II toxin-antitoxin system prevent-host-death family antitoxin [Patescibacteria group bacterium]
MYKQLIASEKFTSIQEAQAGLAKLLAKAAKKGDYYRVMKNNKPLGVLVPDNFWASLVEDLEALSSQSYLAEIKKARLAKKKYSSQETKKQLNL